MNYSFTYTSENFWVISACSLQNTMIKMGATQRSINQWKAFLEPFFSNSISNRIGMHLRSARKYQLWKSELPLALLPYLAASLCFCWISFAFCRIFALVSSTCDYKKKTVLRRAHFFITARTTFTSWNRSEKIVS